MNHSLIAVSLAGLTLTACIVTRPDNCDYYGSYGSTGDTTGWGTGGASYPYGNPGQTTPPPPPPPASRSDAGLTSVGSVDVGGGTRGPLPCMDAGVDGTSVSDARRDGGAQVHVDAGPDIVAMADARPATTCNDAGICGRPTQALCTYSHQCGTGGRCADGECQRPCTSSGTCGTGYTCQTGFCQLSPVAGGQCLYASDCGSGWQCINGYCHAGCAQDGDCPNHADTCSAGLCRPDGRPTPQCRGNGDCPSDRECVNAVCRTPCDSDANCGSACSGTVFKEGFCVEEQELLAQCLRDSSCASGQVCIDAVCLSASK
jgi:hypothetical protein